VTERHELVGHFQHGVVTDKGEVVRTIDKHLGYAAVREAFAMKDGKQYATPIQMSETKKIKSEANQSIVVP